MSDGRVYIVDDDEAVRDSLSVLLESKVYAVRSFASAPEFLKAASALRPGCLIVDIRMPEMDGLELQQRLTDRSLNFPLIVITGHGDVPLAVRAMKAGAVDFIEKPFALEAILSSLEAAFSRLDTSGERFSKSPRSRKARAAVVTRASGLERPPRRAAQQIDCLRFGNQPAHRRDPPRASYGQNGGAQPFRVDPPRFGCRGAAEHAINARISPQHP